MYVQLCENKQTAYSPGHASAAPLKVSNRNNTAKILSHNVRGGGPAEGRTECQREKCDLDYAPVKFGNGKVRHRQFPGRREQVGIRLGL